MNTKITTTILIMLILAQTINVFSQSVGINDDGSQPNARAILDIKSNSRGVILPRLSDSARDAMYRDVPFGMIIFNTTDSALQIFMDTSWYTLSMGAVETAPELTVTDIDGNVYSTVTIGTQTWMAENLKTTRYKDGSSIDFVTDNTTWQSNTTGAYCWYNNDEATYADTYGALYNWHAVNTGNLCPDGWHVPSDDEWKTLEMYLGMSQAQADNVSWRGSNEGSKIAGNADLWTDGSLEYDSEFGSSGFIALPGGRRTDAGVFSDIGIFGFWWSSSENEHSSPWYRGLLYDFTNIYRFDDIYKERGLSVRCLKD